MTNRPVVLGLVSYRIFPALMGGQKCVTGFYDHLAKKTTVVLALSKDNDVSGNSLIKTYRFLYDHWKGPMNLRYLYQLVKLVKRHQVNAIIIEHSYFGWLGIALQRLTGKPYVIRSHNIEAYRFRDMRRRMWRLYEPYEKWVHCHADHNFFITQEDQDIAVAKWKLDPLKCSIITYGTDLQEQPSALERKNAHDQLTEQYGLKKDTILFLFNGSLDYAPNIDALRIIIHELLPRLQLAHDFRIIICGSHLSEQWGKVLEAYPQLILAGFVPDIGLYLKGTDCFINPITLGGGIKTKLVEALAYGLPVITSINGARGIDQALTMGKMRVLEDYNWQAFADAMATAPTQPPTLTPEAFYRHFNWDHIIDKALVSLSAL